MHYFEKAIRGEAGKLIRRHEMYARGIADENVRRARRSVHAQPRLRPLVPPYWSSARGFDPFIVRANANRISYTIRAALAQRAYVPRNPIAFVVPKQGGGERRVSVFQIADNAVSRVFFKRLLDKNRTKMSARSYAYRDDVSVHDALLYLQSEFRTRDRLFVAEYDFSGYFDNIDHEHIRRVLRDEAFLMTPTEEHVIEAFLTAPCPEDAASYSEFGGELRDRGVPQGTSVSLFLANAAAAPLDRALERLGVGFVRYADDTLIWSPDYGQLCRAVDELHEASRLVGSEVNLKKSPGIRLLVQEGASAEIKHTTYVDFVGYRATLTQLEIKRATERRIKRHIQSLMFYNLLHEPLRGAQDPARLGRVDRDYVVFIWQLRRYLYGDLSETELRKYQLGGSPLRRFKGLMSFYPLLDDSQRLRDLDAWLASQTWLVMRKRSALLRAAGLAALPPPHDLDLDQLVRYQRVSATTGGTLDLRLPSARRIARVIRSAARRYGPNSVGRGGNPYNY